MAPEDDQRAPRRRQQRPTPPRQDQDGAVTDQARERRRLQIVTAAKQVFADNGFHDASINEIITRAKIARGTFYLYFESKQAIFESILSEALLELRARLTRIDVSPGAEPPQVQLRHNLVRVISYLLGDRPLTRILLNQDYNPRLDAAEQVGDFFTHATALMESSLDRGIGMGLVRPCNTALISWALLGAVRGVMSYCLSAGEPPDVDVVVDQIIAFALRGVFVG